MTVSQLGPAGVFRVPKGAAFPWFRVAAEPPGPGGESLAYWRTRLAGVPPLDLSDGAPRPSRPTGAGGLHRFRLLDGDAAQRLAELCARHGATEFTGLLAGLKAALAAFSGSTDLAVGTAVSGRTDPAADSLIGFFVNTLVLRTDVSGDPAFTEILGRARDTAVGAFAHQDLPFDELVGVLNPKRDALYSPLFQVMFSLQDVRGRALRLPGVRAEVLEVYNGTSKFDLDVLLTRGDDGVSGVAEYSLDVFGPSRVEYLCAEFVRVLNTALRTPHTPLSRLAGTPTKGTVS
ncbi:condensation domain-containing protein [Streptomyces sp. Rer75]|uniref:condensation domain-containing protein n=1 Tax=Streptomyces sp. Rer75 TaxID=2750011 RepID=UPI0015CF959F|nr:condensation domain-containing protein [Streptomyces sp. Rer75]QLH19584.1 hypothetical protein HYQ63_02095 [Streptomyces sp. Rer75]